MKRILFVLVMLLSFSVVGCSSDKKQAVNSSSEQNQDNKAEESLKENIEEKQDDNVQEETKNEEDVTEGIKGSNYIDIALNLENTGFPKHSVSSMEGTDLNFIELSTYVDEETGATLNYSLSYNQDKEVVNATFDILNTGACSNDVFLAYATSYLKFCSSMPYDSSDSDKVSGWITENINNIHEVEGGSSIVIGDAKFTLSGNMLDSGIIGLRSLEISKDS